MHHFPFILPTAFSSTLLHSHTWCVCVCACIFCFLHIHFVFNSTLTNTEIITTAVQYLILKLCQVCCLPHTNAFLLLILNAFFLLSSFSNLMRYTRSLSFVVVVVCVHFVHFGFHMEVGLCERMVLNLWNSFTFVRRENLLWIHPFVDGFVEDRNVGLVVCVCVFRHNLQVVVKRLVKETLHVYCIHSDN